MGAFSAYMDESGTQDNSLLSVSCLVAAVEQWDRFNSDWQRMLTEEGIPFLHFKDLIAPNSSLYAGLHVRDKNRILNRAVGHMRDHILFGVTATIFPDEYARLTTPRFRSDYGTAYTICVNACAAELAVILSGQLRTPEEKSPHVIDIFLEDGHKNVGQAIEQVRGFKDALKGIDPNEHGVARYWPIIAEKDSLRSLPIEIAGIGTGSKIGPSAFLPLQAADVVAACMNREFRTPHDRISRQVLDAIESRVPLWATRIDESAIERISTELAEAEAEKRQQRQWIYRLKKYLRSFNFDVRELPYGIAIDSTSTPETDALRFIESTDEDL